MWLEILSAGLFMSSMILFNVFVLNRYINKVNSDKDEQTITEYDELPEFIVIDTESYNICLGITRNMVNTITKAIMTSNIMAKKDHMMNYDVDLSNEEAKELKSSAKDEILKTFPPIVYNNLVSVMGEIYFELFIEDLIIECITKEYRNILTNRIGE